ncbi:hypothetical protein TNCV_2801941, partial [Trichonephila clavipes]
MRAKAYCDHLSILDHWVLRCVSTCPGGVSGLKVYSPQARS